MHHLMGYSYLVSARNTLYAPCDRYGSTYHGFVTPVVEYWLERDKLCGCDRSHDPSHQEWTLPMSNGSFLYSVETASYTSCLQLYIAKCPQNAASSSRIIFCSYLLVSYLLVFTCLLSCFQLIWLPAFHLYSYTRNIVWYLRLNIPFYFYFLCC